MKNTKTIIVQKQRVFEFAATCLLDKCHLSERLLGAIGSIGAAFRPVCGCYTPVASHTSAFIHFTSSLFFHIAAIHMVISFYAKHIKGMMGHVIDIRHQKCNGLSVIDNLVSRRVTVFIRQLLVETHNTFCIHIVGALMTGITFGSIFKNEHAIDIFPQ